MAAEVQKVFAHWLNAVRHGETASICALYHAEAIFWGTFSETLRTNGSAICDYFRSFLSPFPPMVDCDEVHWRNCGEVVLNTGRYTFRFPNSDEPIFARFSFVYQLQADGRWLIMNHHSSEVPA